MESLVDKVKGSKFVKGAALLASMAPAVLSTAQAQSPSKIPAFDLRLEFPNGKYELYKDIDMTDGRPVAVDVEDGTRYEITFPDNFVENMRDKGYKVDIVFDNLDGVKYKRNAKNLKGTIRAFDASEGFLCDLPDHVCIEERGDGNISIEPDDKTIVESTEDIVFYMRDRMISDQVDGKKKDIQKKKEDKTVEREKEFDFDGSVFAYGGLGTGRGSIDPVIAADPSFNGDVGEVGLLVNGEKFFGKGYLSLDQIDFDEGGFDSPFMHGDARMLDAEFYAGANVLNVKKLGALGAGLGYNHLSVDENVDLGTFNSVSEVLKSDRFTPEIYLIAGNGGEGFARFGVGPSIEFDSDKTTYGARASLDALVRVGSVGFLVDAEYARELKAEERDNLGLEFDNGNYLDASAGLVLFPTDNFGIYGKANLLRNSTDYVTEDGSLDTAKLDNTSFTVGLLYKF